VTTIIPLAVVLGVTAIKDIVDDVVSVSCREISRQVLALTGTSLLTWQLALSCFRGNRQFSSLCCILCCAQCCQIVQTKLTVTSKIMQWKTLELGYFVWVQCYWATFGFSSDEFRVVLYVLVNTYNGSQQNKKYLLNWNRLALQSGNIENLLHRLLLLLFIVCLCLLRI